MNKRIAFSIIWTFIWGYFAMSYDGVDVQGTGFVILFLGMPASGLSASFTEHFDVYFQILTQVELFFVSTWLFSLVFWNVIASIYVWGSQRNA